MKKIKLMIGRTFKYLKVLDLAPKKEGRRESRYFVKCICGTVKTTTGYELKSGKTKSCGTCLKKTHGMTKTSIYATWQHMHQRCYNKKHKKFKHYGARGIGVCKRWANFDNFYKDMGPRPRGLSIERINNDGDYEPSNCKWATYKEQNINRRGYGLKRRP